MDRSSPDCRVASWLAGRGQVAVVCWAVSGGGTVDARSEYAEQFWLPVIGPSCLWALRRLADWLDACPEGFVLPVGDFGRALGLSGQVSISSPITRTFRRLAGFHLVTLAPDSEALAVSGSLPLVPGSYLARLPQFLVELHQGWHAVL